MFGPLLARLRVDARVNGTAPHDRNSLVDEKPRTAHIGMNSCGCGSEGDGGGNVSCREKSRVAFVLQHLVLAVARPHDGKKNLCFSRIEELAPHRVGHVLREFHVSPRVPRRLQFSA